MKICQVVPCFPYREHLEGTPAESGYHIGGVERHVLEISKALIEKGHSITVLSTQSPAHGKYHEIDAIKIMRVPYGIPLYNSSIPFRIFGHFNPGEYDLIHAHTPNPTIADLVCLKNNGNVPFILTYHNDITKSGNLGTIISYIYNNTLGNSLLEKSDIIITTTQSYTENSIRLRRFKHKIQVIPNGVNPYKFNNNINKNVIFLRHNLHSDSKIILFVGALEEYKGVDILIEAFSQVLDNGISGYLVIVGVGLLSKQLIEMAMNLGISDNVVFAGYVTDIDLPYYYAACDLFVLPSISEKEGFGMVQLEAMSCGKPVISTNLAGVKEVDEDEVASLHIPPGDSNVLADVIIRLLEDETLARTIGGNGRKLVEEKYAWGKIVDKIEIVYKEMRR